MVCVLVCPFNVAARLITERRDDRPMKGREGTRTRTRTRRTMLLAKRTVLFLLALLAAVSVVVVVVRAQHFHGGDPTRFEPDQDTGEGKLGTDYHGLGTEPESASDGHGVGAGEPHEGGEQGELLTSFPGGKASPWTDSSSTSN